MPTVIAPVVTPQGPGRLLIDAAEDPVATLVLGHGAGGGPNATDLDLLARRMPEHGTTVVRFEQPWRTAGRRVATLPAKLDEAWLTALDWLGQESWIRGPLFVGGRSAGARVACRTADVVEPAGIICLAFPLHLPGRPEKSRIAELLQPQAARLVLQGTSDAFGRAAEIQAAIKDAGGIRLVELPGADHSFRLARSSSFTPADLRAALLNEVSRFVDARLGIPSP
jgi:predicted alpha/beta-hydrolase family hydrolase